MPRTPAPTPILTVATVGLLLLTGVHLVAQLLDADRVSHATQVLLMPGLAGWFLARVPRQQWGAPMVRLVLLALFFSWLGDTLPRFSSGDTGFLLMVGGFLVAQLVYAWAFWPARDRSLLRRAPGWLVVYAVVLVGLVVVVAPSAKLLTVAVAGYGLALCAMSVLASGLGRRGLVGGLVFLVSDAMIGLGAFTSLTLPAGGFWIMLTYVAAQWLLAEAVARRHPVVAAPDARPDAAGGSVDQAVVRRSASATIAPVSRGISQRRNSR